MCMLHVLSAATQDVFVPPHPPPHGPKHEQAERRIRVLLDCSAELRARAARKFRAAGLQMPKDWSNAQLQELIAEGNQLVGALIFRPNGTLT